MGETRKREREIKQGSRWVRNLRTSQPTNQPWIRRDHRCMYDVCGRVTCKHCGHREWSLLNAPKYRKWATCKGRLPNRTVTWWKAKVLVMRNREQPSPFLGGGLLPRNQQQPLNSWSSRLDTHEMENRILSRSRGHRLMRKQAAIDTGRRTLDSDKRKAPGSSAKVRG